MKVEKNKKKKKIRAIGLAKYPADILLIMLVVILIVFGTLMIFSASYHNLIANGGNPFSTLFRQLMWVAVVFVVLRALSVYDCNRYKNIAKPIYGVAVILLLLLFIPGVGTEVNGSVRWIYIGPISIMPGEIAKIAMIVFFAWLLSKNGKFAGASTYGLLTLVISSGVILVLVGIENLSTALTIGCIIIIMEIIAGVKKSHLLIAALIAVIGGIFLIFSDSLQYRLARFSNFMDPFADASETGYQVANGLKALGAGGLFGVGPGKSVQKALYLPESQNDFILAIIGEELGFAGTSLLMIVYVLIVWRCLKIAMEANDLYQKLLVGGVIGMIGVQVIFNVAVVTATMPPTGVALPFVSYGGNALLVCAAGIGIVLNVSRQNEKRKEMEKEGELL